MLNKPVVYVRQEIKTPIITTTGMIITAQPYPVATIDSLVIRVLETNEKLLRNGEDVRESVDHILSQLDVIEEDIENYPRKKRATRTLERI